MNSELTRRNFLTLAAVGAASMALAPTAAFASEANEESLGNSMHAPQGNTLLDFKDPAFPGLRVVVTDTSIMQTQSEGSCSVEITSAYKEHNEETNEGVVGYEIALLEPKREWSPLPGMDPLNSQYGGISDVVASIDVTAYYTMGSRNKTIKLTKASVVFKAKKGTVTNRNITVMNYPYTKKYTKIVSMSKTCTFDWGYVSYNAANQSTFHFINVWATATPSGMGGKRDISVLLPFGD